jgi:hypothetical protein
VHFQGHAICGVSENSGATVFNIVDFKIPTINETVKTVCGTYTFDGRRWKSDSEQK